ncbi:hypothetical protein Desku_1806 [Desulfofundulus kuznetsovii DSM 6115]|uniref:Mg2 transporter protein CorA family protein n=1 Tax=Desulfofundulus kuznetsovii (strain DSM 6115 / VKM B-1805 / 17) TaxID=760568 RepID=A0AAU8Q359_DESK7|nr:hypothetical protein Desku_1806 [Desulfofundulus kuznetsovii DSM 6115]
MNNIALYFPFIQVPQTRWFTQVLLYWDEVASIVPFEFIYKPEALGPYMRELVKEGLVRQIFPQEYIQNVPRFSESFFEFLDNTPIVRSIRNNFRFRYVEIHIEKLSDIGRELCERGLAYQKNSSWYFVEENTAIYFMTYLAFVLGQVEHNFIPVTDYLKNIQIHHMKINKKNLNRMIAKNNFIIDFVESILPAPSTSVSPYQIAEFKGRYRDELRRFRQRLESLFINISSIADNSLRQEKIKLARQNFKEEIEELISKMNANRWQTMLGSICAITPLVTELFTMNSLDNYTGLVTNATSSLILAVSGAFQGYRYKQELYRSPLAYAALAHKHFKLVPGPRQSRTI